MRTTVHLDENLLRRAKREAHKRGETLTSLIEQGLRLMLTRSRPGIDLNDSAALLDRMEGRH